jgi:hypothetical protein
VTLNSFGVFEHGAGSATLWLDPCNEALLRLQARLSGAFPSCQDVNNDPQRGITKFRPHLSLGQSRPGRDLRAMREVSASTLSLSLSLSLCLSLSVSLALYLPPSLWVCVCVCVCLCPCSLLPRPQQRPPTRPGRDLRSMREVC